MMIFKVFGIAFGALIGIILLYLIIVIFAPGFNVAKQPFPISESATKDRDNAPAELVESVSFEVGGLKISGWLYLPENIPFPVPCIIMNHGFGGTKDVALEPYALRFRDVGIAVLTAKAVILCCFSIRRLFSRYRLCSKTKGNRS